MKNLNKLCPHFHLSIQSLSTSVLKRMNRKYSVDFVKDRINCLRESFEDVSITCDLIVGFINETEEEFNETLNNALKLEFSDMHVFQFSKREGTLAYNMKSFVTDDVKHRRSELLIEVGKKTKEKFLNRYIGKSLEVLFDEKENGKLYGYTSNYIKVRGEGDNLKWGEIQNLEFGSQEEGMLIGKLKKN